MSFRGWKKYIEEGDLVIVYLTRESMSPIFVKADDEVHNRFGIFKHNDMIGKEFGSKMVASNYRGFVYLLHPTPELWTLCLPHRTQILYIADISFISTQLDMKPGARVVESGTGSGSFSHSIARTIAPTGKLFSFEYHEERARLAGQEFQQHGLGDIIQIQHRDVCKDGFGLSDAGGCTVFLDLPAPWEAIASAKAAFKQHRTGKICCFSPCIEQVAKSVKALNENGFIDITMYECLIRNHYVMPLQKLKFEEAIEKAKTEPQAHKRKNTEIDAEDTVNTLLVSKTPLDTRGHTSYLTFATFLPAIDNNLEQNIEEQAVESVSSDS
ncbi:tRNA (adenine(58)-N(1))-methyltransferase catalytic subunit trmt61a [Apophysomyces sp. BC1034]|nr:tRNA (adenine(58)-N(1))-methyltransferase catalytic subunit trmt61a [Apophysomyces sp. BC1015]KAG0181184.1 tRNA (adenine(58)-N(1))-methyltransferase catalytic subunit trmt61a [Apophysomyces sp. BC1021]KAG0191642.1 tRNA (adenine(58)-N(1))-methyltransferase catalytic subunit trmt61a [Apophysomyces sp. BC1034]